MGTVSRLSAYANQCAFSVSQPVEGDVVEVAHLAAAAAEDNYTLATAGRFQASTEVPQRLSDVTSAAGVRCVVPNLPRG